MKQLSEFLLMLCVMLCIIGLCPLWPIIALVLGFTAWWAWLWLALSVMATLCVVGTLIGLMQFNNEYRDSDWCD